MNNIKRLDFKQSKFIANGKTYYIEYDQMTITRFQEYERLGVEMGFGVQYQDLYKTLSDIYTTLTTGNSILEAHNKAATIALNQMSAIKDQGEKRVPQQVLFCTLFINEKGEDLTTWSYSAAMDKIEDWKKEGIAAIDFFTLAANMLSGFQESLANILTVAKLQVEQPSLTQLIDFPLSKEKL